jgi:hypothetical protein
MSEKERSIWISKSNKPKPTSAIAEAHNAKNLNAKSTPKSTHHNATTPPDKQKCHSLSISYRR